MKIKKTEILFLLLYAAVLITSVSVCAPQRIFTDNVDINIIFSVGKSFWKGKIVYRDLFEHKGPLMYAITAVAALISNHSFTGVWILEVAACAVFLIVVLAMIRELYPSASGLLLPAVSFFIYRSYAFVAGTAEEFCLPMLAIALYIGVRSICSSRMPTFKESVILGITSAIVFWIKYNMIGFYIGFLLAFILFCFKSQEWKDLGTAAAGALTGLLAVTIPILIFFAVNGALKDLFQVYFLDNINNYANRLDFLYQGYYGLTGTMDTIKNNLLCWGLILFGIIELIAVSRNPRIILLVLLSLFFTAWFVYCGGMKFRYYGFILLLFAVLAAGYEFGLPIKNSFSLLAVSCIAFGILSGTKISVSDPEEIKAMPQFQLTSLITEPDASLLTYDYFDAGFYTAGNLYPSEYHFTLTNCVIDQASAAQKMYLENGSVDYVVTMEDLSFASNYVLIAESNEWALYKRS